MVAFGFLSRRDDLRLVYGQVRNEYNGVAGSLMSWVMRNVHSH
jgi:hypothetical protein